MIERVKNLRGPEDGEVGPTGEEGEAGAGNDTEDTRRYEDFRGALKATTLA